MEKEYVSKIIVRCRLITHDPRHGTAQSKITLHISMEVETIGLPHWLPGMEVLRHVRNGLGQMPVLWTSEPLHRQRFVSQPWAVEHCAPS